MQYSCQPLSRNDLRAYATQIRRALNLSKTLYFPVLRFLEALHVLIGDDDFNFEVVEDSEWQYPLDRHAYYDLDENTIYIRSSIYDGACAGNGRDRMTIIHECAHVLLLRHSHITLSRSFVQQVPAYCDPEWQAKCLAGELMIPYDLVPEMSAIEVVTSCGVSLRAARYQLGKLPKNRRSDQTTGMA